MLFWGEKQTFVPII